MSNTAALKSRALRAEAERDFLQSLIDSFFTGDVPESASLEHLILAKWGRKRIEEQRSQPALLRSGSD